ncbi:MAG: lipoyl(octanoyl) transferase LipB [Flavobacteriales bacterium]
MISQNKRVQVIDLGLIDFKAAWDIQEKLLESIINQKIANRDLDKFNQTDNYLLFCEHPHVYTLGKSGSAEHLLLNNQGLEEKKATFYKINRGGDITYHGPGQLVMYPIFDLDNFFTDIHKYLRYLEEAAIQVCAQYGIMADRYEGYTGVWLDADKPSARKICAMGVKCSRWVTMHGIAFNVKPDLSYFNHIIPCGIKDKDVTSLQRELGAKCPSLDEVKENLLQAIESVFEFQTIKISLQELEKING